MKYQHGSTFVWSWLCSNLRSYDIDLHCMFGSHGSTLYFSGHEFFVSHMDLHCIGWKPCCESFGTNVKGATESF